MNTPLSNPKWDRQENEPSLWYGRFRIFLELGPGRSVNAALDYELTKKHEKPRRNADKSWYHMAREYEWEQRAQAYDAHWIKEQDAIIAQERAKIVRTGFALQHKRIQELDKITQELIDMKKDPDKVWVPGTKVFWNGKNAELIDTISFNHQLYSLILKYLGDIAAEMGERKQKIEMIEEVGINKADEKALHQAVEKALSPWPEAKWALAEALDEYSKTHPS
jgi:hypothetical protein